MTRFSLFRHMHESQIRHVADAMTNRRYTKDKIIIRVGDIGDEEFVFFPGIISISKSLTLHNMEGTDQRDKSLIQLSESDDVFFGEMSLLGNKERSATLIAKTDVELGISTESQVRELRRLILILVTDYFIISG
ncbi:MAG: cyclic nucleotide-binding domain-containing protein [Calditrichaeota bacterium]|nr:cyclic nucleotide-binding domain-containing protein [Calditrichota bacterium]